MVALARLVRCVDLVRTELTEQSSSSSSERSPRAASTPLSTTASLRAFSSPSRSSSSRRCVVSAPAALIRQTGVGYAFHSAQGDIAGAAAITWTLFGVFSARAHPGLIHWAALGSAIVSAIAVAKALFTTSRGVTSGGERAPLLSDA